MSARRGIALLRIERRSLIQFVALYVGSTALLLLLVSVVYYHYQKTLLLDSKRASMQSYAERVVDSVFDARTLEELERYYAEDKRYGVGFYDARKQPYFTTFRSPVNFKRTFYFEGDLVFYIDRIELGYLPPKFVVVRAEGIANQLDAVIRDLAMIFALSMLVIGALAVFFGRMFLRPLREYIAKLDQFIKDTTHEINIPVAAITMTIETIERAQLDAKLSRKIQRIDVAARTIAGLYRDMSFLTLQKTTQNRDEIVNLQQLLEERVHYFEPAAEAHGVLFVLTLESVCWKIDPGKLATMIDDLISNAIKYNRKGGHVEVGCNVQGLWIADEGIGIPPERIEVIFKRYTRLDEATGGFGIGLAIVKMIADEYGIRIEVQSRPKEGSRFFLHQNATAC